MRSDFSLNPVILPANNNNSSPARRARNPPRIGSQVPVSIAAHTSLYGRETDRDHLRDADLRSA